MDKPSRLRQFLTLTAIYYLLLIFVNAGLILLTNKSVALGQLLTTGCLLLWPAIGLGLIGFLGTLVEMKCARIFLYPLIGLIALMILGFFAQSWNLYFQTGHFIGVSALQMLSHDTWQVMQHAVDIDLKRTVVLILGLGLFTFALIIEVPRYVTSMRAFSTKACIAVGIISLCTSVLASLMIAQPVKGLEPAGALYQDYQQQQQMQARLMLPSGKINFTRNPAISFKTYLSKVDINKLKKPNIIVILIESLRYDALKSFGGSKVVMPTVESLALKGARFQQAYAQSSHSNYADLDALNSRYPMYSLQTYYYPKEFSYPRVLIYDILKKLGYATAIISSQNEHWGGMLNYLDTGSLDTIIHAQNYKGKIYLEKTGNSAFNEGVVKQMLGHKKAGKIDDHLTVLAANQWINKLPKQKPFFIYMNLQSSHYPFREPGDGIRKFNKLRWKPTGMIPLTQVKKLRARYDESLAYIDRQIALLLKNLKKQHRLKNTVFVISGDTGFAMGEHKRIGNAWYLHQATVHLPLLLSGAGIKERNSRSPAGQIDVPPTLLGLIGLPAHPSFEGIDLLQAKANKSRYLFFVAQSPFATQYGVMRDGFKLLFTPKDKHYALYDLKHDPTESKDVSAKHPQLDKQLKTALFTWLTSHVEYYQEPAMHADEYVPTVHYRAID